ncbi:MAG: CinA family protein [Candidatus Omnitrophota bacterium]
MNRETKLINILKNKKLTIATAESITAGYLSYLLTKTPGASEIFKGGVIVYSLESKNNLFKIPLSTLKKTKGISPEIVIILARKIRDMFASDIGISIVGFAGPGARKGVKPGTVFIGIAYSGRNLSQKLLFDGNRGVVRKKASLHALDMLSRLIR